MACEKFSVDVSGGVTGVNEIQCVISAYLGSRDSAASSPYKPAARCTVVGASDFISHRVVQLVFDQVNWLAQNIIHNRSGCRPIPMHCHDFLALLRPTKRSVNLISAQVFILHAKAWKTFFSSGRAMQVAQNGNCLGR
jgi:hypothetical protein